jgi:hypothetical protein
LPCPCYFWFKPSLVKIHWRILILVFDPVILTLKINRVPDSRKD